MWTELFEENKAEIEEFISIQKTNSQFYADVVNMDYVLGRMQSGWFRFHVYRGKNEINLVTRIKKEDNMFVVAMAGLGNIADSDAACVIGTDKVKELFFESGMKMMKVSFGNDVRPDVLVYFQKSVAMYDAMGLPTPAISNPKIGSVKAICTLNDDLTVPVKVVDEVVPETPI